MKNKNTFRLLFIVAIAIMLTLPSCQKYADGPLISLVSRTERVANTWKVDNYKVNGVDYTSLMTDYNETYTKEGTYSYSMGIVSGTGTWSFQNKDEEINLVGITNQNSYTLFILKLEEKSFWFYYMDGTDKKEFHMNQK